MKDWLRSLTGRSPVPAAPDAPARGPSTRVVGASFTGPSARAGVLCPSDAHRRSETVLIASSAVDGPGPGDGEISFLVLDGPSSGELLVAWSGPLDLPLPAALLLADRTSPVRGPSARSAPVRIGPGELTGAGIAGVTGVRALYRTASSAGLRLGPPPGARWVVEGLRSVAVFEGKLGIDGGEGLVELRSGSVAAVSDPRHEVIVLAGNDSARAVAFCDPGFRVRLG